MNFKQSTKKNLIELPIIIDNDQSWSMRHES